MELIKQIKEAEAQAKELVVQAKVDAAKLAEQAEIKQAKMRTEAETERKEAIGLAVVKGAEAGKAEIKDLKTHAQQQQQGMELHARARMDAATAKVMETLRG